MIFNRQKEAAGIYRFIEFTLTRNIGTLVDCGVLWILADLVFPHSSYLCDKIISPTISFEMATFVNYLTSYAWVYSTRIADRSPRAFFRRFLTFNVSSVMGFILKMALLLLFDHWLHWHIVLCNFLALMLSGIFNYFIAELWVFGRKRALPAPSDIQDDKPTVCIDDNQ